MHDLPNRSLAVQRSALQSGALIPLKTELISGADERFQLRRLISATPKHLTKAGPKPNPFRPWDPRLEVACQPASCYFCAKILMILLFRGQRFLLCHGFVDDGFGPIYHQPGFRETRPAKMILVRRKRDPCLWPAW